MSKTCKIPGCGKELPSDSKLPVCEYHKAVAAENGKKAGMAVLSVGATAVVFVAKNGTKVLKEGLRFIKP